MRTLVTGANGHLGLNLVQALLQRGHQVRASVRSLADAAKIAPLRALGDVEIVAARLDQPKALRAAMEGIETVFHAAAVYSISDAGRQAEMLSSALSGTENTLRAAADAAVRKVVLTSSVVTLPLCAAGEGPRTETDWTHDLRVPYFRAKTEGEQLAWRLSDDLRLNLVSILPGGILGPGFGRNTPTIDLVEMAMLGGFRLGVPQGNFTFVDARDVALAHVLAAQADAHGRFIAVTAQPSYRELVETLRRIDSSISSPLMDVPAMLAPLLPAVDAFNHKLLGTPRTATPEAIATTLSGLSWNVSSARARSELGWQPAFDFEQSLRETVKIIAARLATKKRG